MRAGGVSSLLDCLVFSHVTRHFRAGLSHAAATRLEPEVLTREGSRQVSVRGCLRLSFLFSRFTAAHLGHPFPRIHGAATFRRAAVARGRVFVVVEVVVPDEFFAGGNGAQGKDPDPAFDLVHFAVGIAGMIQVGAQTLAVDYGLAVIQPVQIGAGSAVVKAVGFFGGDARSGVLDHAGALADRCRGVYTDRVNGRW